MPVYALGPVEPAIHPDAYVHPDAVVIGNVSVGAHSSIWPGAVLRGDDGRIEVGEPSVVIAVAAAHRRGTFDACSYAIERLKAIVPIWKKEVGRDGQWWVEGPREANPAHSVVLA